MSKTQKDREIVERVTDRFVRSNQNNGKKVSRQDVRAAVVRHMVRRDLQGKN